MEAMTEECWKKDDSGVVVVLQVSGVVGCDCVKWGGRDTETRCLVYLGGSFLATELAHHFGG